MLKLAAERTAGAVPYNVTPEHTRAARAALGPDKLLAVEQKVCLQTDATAARGLARRELHRYMTLTNYRNNWLRLGFTEADLADGGSDRFIDAMVLWGDPATITRGLRAHLEAGANSSLHSAGPCGGRHGSARPNPEGARRCLSLLKLLFTADAVGGTGASASSSSDGIVTPHRGCVSTGVPIARRMRKTQLQRVSFPA